MSEPATNGGTAPPAAAGGPRRAIDLNYLLRIMRSSGSELLAQAGLYLQLLRLEWAEERARLRGLVVTTLCGFAFLLALLGAVSALWLAIFWDTRYRVPAAATLVAAYAVGLAWAWLRGQELLRQGERSFSATREQLAADLAVLGREQ
jgi:uncharacterized membrane protein YqjE